MRVTSKGQVTIPVEIRERFGLLPGTEVEWEATAYAVRLRKARKRGGRGARLIRRLKGRGDVATLVDSSVRWTC